MMGEVVGISWCVWDTSDVVRLRGMNGNFCVPFDSSEGVPLSRVSTFNCLRGL